MFYGNFDSSLNICSSTICWLGDALKLKSLQSQAFNIMLGLPVPPASKQFEQLAAASEAFIKAKTKEALLLSSLPSD